MTLFDKKICAPLATMAKALFTNGNPVWIKCGVGAQSAWLNILSFKADKFRKRSLKVHVLTIWKSSISWANKTYQPNLPTLLSYSSAHMDMSKWLLVLDLPNQ